MSDNKREPPDPLTTRNQVAAHLRGLGYTMSTETVYAHVRRGALRPLAAGGWSKRAVESYAASVWGDKRVAVDPLPERLEPREPTEPSAAVERTMADAELKRVAAERARFAFDRERGRFVETRALEAELGARAKAFRLGLEKFALDNAGDMLALVGGDADSARELCAELGIETVEGGEAKLQSAIAWVQSRTDAVRRFWLGRVEELLDAYATGRFWTEDMRQAWDKLEAAGDE